MNDLYIQTAAVMLLVVLACRCGGLTIGIVFGENPRIHRILDIAPSCAIGAVLGPSVASASLPEAVALIAAALVFLCTDRFVLSLGLAAALLALGPEILAFLPAAPWTDAMS